MTKKMKGEIAIIALLVAMSLVYIILAQGMRSEARQFPQLVGVIVLLLLIWELTALLVKNHQAKKQEIEPPKNKKNDSLLDSKVIQKRHLILAITLVLYLLLFRLLGFLIASFLLVLGQLWLFGLRNKLATLLFSGFLVGTIYVVFNRLLYIPLPSGIFF